MWDGIRLDTTAFRGRLKDQGKVEVKAMEVTGVQGTKSLGLVEGQKSLQLQKVVCCGHLKTTARRGKERKKISITFFFFNNKLFLK